MTTPESDTVEASGFKPSKRLATIGTLVLLLTLLGGVGGGAFASGAAREVTPAEDNPPGCKTATAEDTPQCGAQGRDHFGNEEHEPPVEACDDRRSDAGSVLTRRLPDGPRRPDGSLAFISGVCVYLPPDYETSGLRYPVVYLLHGGGGDQADWQTFGSAQKILDDSFSKDPANAVIAVLPDGRSGFWFDGFEKDAFKNETYVLDHVLPYIDSEFRTIADRRGRAIIGLSNGGYGALHLAAKAPDQFLAAGAMSGNLGARSIPGLDSPVVPGGPKTSGTYYEGNVPARLVPNLDPVDLTIDWGATCSSDLTVDLCGTWAFEQTFRLDNQFFRDELERLDYTGTYEYRETEGSHAWRWWTKWLRERQLPFVLDRLSEPEPAKRKSDPSPIPATFRYRSIAPSFDIFGYSVNVNRPALEFLDLTKVTADGFVVRGSGSAVVTTADRYNAGRKYLVTGTGGDDQLVSADREGRLRIPVNLGPGHQFDQHSPQGQGQTSDEAYFTTRTVNIVPANGSAAESASPIDTPTKDAANPVAPGPGGVFEGTSRSAAGRLGPASGPDGAIVAEVPVAGDQSGAAQVLTAQPSSRRTSLATASKGVPATSFLILLLLVGIAVGFADHLPFLHLQPFPRVPTLMAAVVGSISGGVLGYVLGGFDFDRGAIQFAGVLGSLLGATMAVAVPALLRQRNAASTT